jgi:hypothetical protein
MEAAEVEKLRKTFGLENAAPVLTLQPVIGQRKSRPVEIRVGQEHSKNSFVNGHVNEEARELRRFDHVREEPRRGRGRPGSAARGKPGGPKGPGGRGRGGGARDDNFGNRLDGPPPRHAQHDRPFVPRGPKPHEQRTFTNQPRGDRPQGNKPYGNKPGGGRPPRGNPPAGNQNPAEFRSWYVPEGVETGSKVAPPRGQRHTQKPWQQRGPSPHGHTGHGDGAYNKPHGQRGPRPSGPGGPGGNRGPQGARGPRPEGNRGPHPAGNRGPRPAEGNRGPRPAGNRGPRPGGPRRRPDGLPSDD